MICGSTTNHIAEKQTVESRGQYAASDWLATRYDSIYSKKSRLPTRCVFRYATFVSLDGQRLRYIGESAGVSRSSTDRYQWVSATIMDGRTSPATSTCCCCCCSGQRRLIQRLLVQANSGRYRCIHSLYSSLCVSRAHESKQSDCNTQRTKCAKITERKLGIVENDFISHGNRIHYGLYTVLRCGHVEYMATPLAG